MMASALSDFQIGDKTFEIWLELLRLRVCGSSLISCKSLTVLHLACFWSGGL